MFLYRCSTLSVVMGLQAKTKLSGVGNRRPCAAAQRTMGQPAQLASLATTIKASMSECVPKRLGALCDSTRSVIHACCWGWGTVLRVPCADKGRTRRRIEPTTVHMPVLNCAILGGDSLLISCLCTAGDLVTLVTESALQGWLINSSPTMPPPRPGLCQGILESSWLAPPSGAHYQF